jgi:hypothetical protein
MTLLLLNCLCGKEYRYPTNDDIPTESVTCECGRSIIKYTEVTP